MLISPHCMRAFFFVFQAAFLSRSQTVRRPYVHFPALYAGFSVLLSRLTPRAPSFGLTLSDRSRLRIGDRRPDLPLSYLPKVPPGSPMNACARAFSGERRNCGDLLSWTANDVVSQFRRQNYNKLATLASICSPKGDHRHFFVKSTPAY